MKKKTFSWLDRNEYPFTSRYLQVNDQQLHYIDEGYGDVIVFVHGTPSWSFDFRKVIRELKNGYRCIALDHIGFGLSDKPADYDYTIRNHCRVLEYFITQMDLHNITLVMHDFGGPIGFHYALSHPQNIRSIVVMNSWLWDFSHDKNFKRVSSMIKSPLTTFLYKYVNFSPRFLLPKSFGKNKLSKNVQRHYTEPFASPSERIGALAFAHSLINDQDWFQTLWEQREILQGKPAMFIWGLMDKFIKPHFLEKFMDGFENATREALDHCGHFPQEENPAEVVRAIKLLLKGE